MVEFSLLIITFFCTSVIYYKDYPFYTELPGNIDKNELN